jgi:serine protease Do
VIVIGSPLGSLSGTVSDGIVAAIRHGGDLIQITAPISHGSSGSPVLNDQGKLTGVAVAGIEEGQNLNFAISAVYVSRLWFSTPGRRFR